MPSLRDFRNDQNRKALVSAGLQTYRFTFTRNAATLLMNMRHKTGSPILKYGIGSIVAAGILATIYFGFELTQLNKAKGYIERNELIQLEEFASNNPHLVKNLLVDAFQLKNQEAFDVLLKHQEGLDGIKHGRLTLLHSTARDENSFWIESLLKNGANPDFPAGHRSIHPISEAIEANRPKNVKLLIDYDADINVRSARNESMLTKSWSMRNGEIAWMLLKAGIEFNPPSRKPYSFINKFQRMSKTRIELDSSDVRDEDFMEKTRTWFVEQNLDLDKAVWEELVPGEEIGRWNIPKIDEHRQTQ